MMRMHMSAVLARARLTVQVNLVLFPGGAASLKPDSPFMQAAQWIFEQALAMNINGDRFPVHGACTCGACAEHTHTHTHTHTPRESMSANGPCYDDVCGCSRNAC